MKNSISKNPEVLQKQVITIFDFLKTKNRVPEYKCFIDPNVLSLPRHYHGILLKQQNMYKSILRTKKEDLDVQKLLLDKNFEAFSYYIEIKKKILERKNYNIDQISTKINPEFIMQNLRNSKEVESSISKQLINDKEIIKNIFCEKLIKLFNCLNLEKIDEEGIVDFIDYINNRNDGQINGILVHYGSAIFAQAFNSNPSKFDNLTRIIPINAASEVSFGYDQAHVICHSVSTRITSESLKHSLEIAFANKLSHNINETIVVKLDQPNSDSEIHEILKDYLLLNYPTQFNTDLSILYKNGTREDVDIKSYNLNRISESPFQGIIIQTGSVGVQYIEKEERNMFTLKLLREWDRLLNREKEIAAKLGTQISIEKQNSFDVVKNLITLYNKTGEPRIIHDINNEAVFLTAINHIIT